MDLTVDLDLDLLMNIYIRNLSHSYHGAITLYHVSIPTAATTADKTTAKMEPIIHTLYEPKTGTWQYIVACPKTKEAAIIDPVLNFEPAAFKVSTESADALLEIAKKEEYKITYLLETHAHADHLTAAYYIQQTLWAAGQPHAPICINENITIVQKTFGHRYNIPKEELENAFDRLLRPNETFQIGELNVTVLHLPGHTPDHGGYRIGNNVFTGDSIFNPDVGSARCDFPGGDARTLWQSMQKLLNLPEDTKLYTGHDYPPSNESPARDPLPYTTVRDQRERNKHVKTGSTEEEFVRWRSERDSGLNEPRLLHQAMQVNVRGGKMPGKAHDGKTMMQFIVHVPNRLLTGQASR